MRLYLDTCIVNDIFVLLQSSGENGLAQDDVKRPIHKWISEYIALYYLLDLNDQWDIEFGTSHIMYEELRSMQTPSAFKKQKRSTLSQTYDGLVSKTRFSELIPVPEYLSKKISEVLPGRKDIEHVCQAVLGGWDYFITTDFDSILCYANLLKPLGITAVSPRTFVEEKFMTLEQLVRTLHGSWTNLTDIEHSLIADITTCVKLGPFETVKI